MSSLRFPELLVALFMLIAYGVVFFVVWKFYQVLARMNDNLTGIRLALERNGERPHGS